MAVNVNSVYRLIFRALTHVFKERNKTIAPFFTHGYSSRAIYSVLLVVLVEASTFCMTPSFVFFAFLALAVWEVSLSMRLSTKAAAAFGYTGSQSAGENKRSSAAITKAKPAYKYAPMWSLLLNGNRPIAQTG